MARRDHGPLIAAVAALAVGLAALALLARADSGRCPRGAVIGMESAAPSETVTVTPIASGGRGEILVTWTTTASGVACWEYRLSQNDFDPPWGAWTAVPSSGPTTASYRLSGLRADTGYLIQVRARTATDALIESGEVQGYAIPVGADGIPRIMGGIVSEGGYSYRLSGSHFVVDVPAGMLVMGGGVALNRGPDTLTVSLIDVATGSYLLMNPETGQWVERVVIPATQAEGGAAARPRDVNALFDQIVASTRRQPAP